jgi:hypothetical protein
VNILIIGGLFALGIVAILGVVLLGRGEQRQHTARTNGTEVQAPSPVEPPPTSDPEVQAVSRSQRLTIPLDRTPTLVGLDEQPTSVRLTQPFLELVDEIRALHQHAWDLEQRLGRLPDMVDHVERVQNGHTSVEEEQSLL